MTRNDAATLSRPYGRHAATRGTARAVRATKGPGRHAARGPRTPLAELAPVVLVEGPEPRALADRAPLVALVALFVLLLLAVGIGTAGTSAVADTVERPAAAADEPADSIEEDEPGWNCATMGNRTCGPLTGTDAGLITAPAN